MPLMSVISSYFVPSIPADMLLQIFACHGVGGIVGNLMTALFAQASVAAFDGFSVIDGGWFDHHYG